MHHNRTAAGSPRGPVTLIDRPASVEEFLRLRRAVGWGDRPAADCAAALASSAAAVVAVDLAGTVVGMARVSADRIHPR